MTLFNSVDLRSDHLMMTHELVAAGYDDKAIARMRKAGELHRLRHGAYTFGAHWADLDQVGRRQLVALATLRSARVPVALTGPSAGDSFGVPVWDMGEEVHLARVDQRAGRREGGKAQHRGVLLAEDITVRDGIPLTSGTRTAIEMIMLADTEHALVTVNGLLHADETTVPLLERRLAGMSQVPETLNAPIVLALADGRCESAGETRVLWLCWSQHLPAPEPQYRIRNRGGRTIARVDFAWPGLKTYLEFDGKEKYLRYRRPGETVADAVIREKNREALICGLTGWRCIRIVWADLFYPERTAARILATLNGQLWAA